MKHTISYTDDCAGYAQTMRTSVAAEALIVIDGSQTDFSLRNGYNRSDLS